jgi:hypothetical protein
MSTRARRKRLLVTRLGLTTPDAMSLFEFVAAHAGSELDTREGAPARGRVALQSLVLGISVSAGWLALPVEIDVHHHVVVIDAGLRAAGLDLAATHLHIQRIVIRTAWKAK